MALTRSQIVDAALIALTERGLPGLSMRGLALELGVQPGALYHHVASKQDLLAAVGERILSDRAAGISWDDPAQAVAEIRTALLPIRDAGEVISFVYAYRPETLAPLRKGLAATLGEDRGRRVGEALISFVLGFVALEQNRAELVRARVLPADAAPVANEDAFTYGVRALLEGTD